MFVVSNVCKGNVVPEPDYCQLTCVKHHLKSQTDHPQFSSTEGTNRAFCSAATHLLGDRAAVFFRHSLPHCLLHRLHLFSKRDAGGSGWFDYFLVHKISFFTLAKQNVTHTFNQRKWSPQTGFIHITNVPPLRKVTVSLKILKFFWLTWFSVIYPFDEQFKPTKELLFICLKWNVS